MTQGKRKKVKDKSIQPCLLLFAFCFLPFAFSSAACGRKGDPRAPELAIPEAIRDLKAEAGEKGIVLTWSRPLHFADGKEIRDLVGFIVLRQDLPQKPACPDCPVPYRERITVDVEDQGRFIKKKKFRFIDQELQSQTAYRYRVFAQLADGTLSGRSNEAEASWRP